MPDPFAAPGRPPSGHDVTAAPSGYAAATSAAIEEGSRFFGRQDRPGAAARPPHPSDPGHLEPEGDRLGGFQSPYGGSGAFEPIDDFDREPTPALLAAKAEPLGGPSTGRPSRRVSRPGRSRAGDAAQASRARAAARQKPKEPSRSLLALGFVIVLLAGVGAAYLLTRGGDDGPAPDDLVVADDQTSDDAAGTEGDGAGTTEAPAGPATSEPPVVIFDQAAVGPIEASTPYTIAVGNGPASAQYQLLVDGEPQAAPAPELPPVSFTPGRHLLVVNITSPEGDLATDPVVVYAVGETPPASYRANLSSVDIANEGWAEAVRQFDEFVAAGHTELQLMPADRIPSLKQGYWNLFVGGFPDSASALAYCEQYGLTVPDQCFPLLADPDAPPGG